MNSKLSLHSERPEASMYRLICTCSLILFLLPVFSNGAPIDVDAQEENAREDAALAQAILQNESWKNDDFGTQNRGMTTSVDENIPEESKPEVNESSKIFGDQIEDAVSNKETPRESKLETGGAEKSLDTLIEDTMTSGDGNTPKRRTKRIARYPDTQIDDAAAAIDEITPEDSKVKIGKNFGTQTDDPVATDESISEESDRDTRKSGDRSVTLIEDQTPTFDEHIPEEPKLETRGPRGRGGRNQDAGKAPSPKTPPNRKSGPPSPRRAATNYLQAKRSMNAPQAPLTLTAPSATPGKVAKLSSQRSLQRSNITWSNGRRVQV